MDAAVYSPIPVVIDGLVRSKQRYGYYEKEYISNIRAHGKVNFNMIKL